MTHARKEWTTFAGEFYRDGSLRDICVLGTTLEDWRKTLKFIFDQKYPIEFSNERATDDISAGLQGLFPTVPNHEIPSLRIDVSGVLVVCHFFGEEEIEFDLDPTDVADAAKLDALFRFMIGLANALAKDVLLTPESAHEIVIFRCRPGASRIEHIPFGGYH